MPRISKKVERERRNNLIAMAQKEFLTKGFSGTTVKDITDQLDLATGTFYYHFKSKDDLLVAVTEGILETEMLQMKELCEAKQLDVFDRIRSAINIIYDTFNHNKKIWMQICRDLTLHNQFYITGMNKIAPYMECLLRDGNASGAFSFVHPREMAEVVISIIDFYIGQYSITTDESRRQRLFVSMEQALVLVLGEHCAPIFDAETQASSALEAVTSPI